MSDTLDGGHLYWYCRAKSSHGATCDSVNYADAEIKDIFCKVMGQEAFSENFFRETMERMTVQKTGSIDFHLKDGTVRAYETLKLRSNRHEEPLHGGSHQQPEKAEGGRVRPRRTELGRIRQTV